MQNGFKRGGRFPGRTSGQRLGLTLGVVAAAASALLPLASRAQHAPVNIMFLLDNHESMQDFPQYLPEAFTPGYYPAPANPGLGDLGGEGPAGLATNTGCSDPALVSAMGWFDKNSPEPQLNGSIPIDSDPAFYDQNQTPQFFDPNRFYASRGNRLSSAADGTYPSTVSSNFDLTLSYADAFSACYAQLGWQYEYYQKPLAEDCQTCLATKGWWRGPVVTPTTLYWLAGPIQRMDQPPLPPEAYRKWVVSGRVLNVRPPRFVGARKAIKDVIDVVSNARMGVATLGSGNYEWFDPPEILEPMRPACDLSRPTVNEAALNRPALKQAVNRTQFRNPERSTGEALFGLGGYFSSQRVDDKWSNWFQQPINPGYFGWPGCCNGGTYDDPYTGKPGAPWAARSDEWLQPPSVNPYTGWWLPGQPWEGQEPNQKSICSYSQVNAIILVTGGTPSQENSVPITRMMELLEASWARHPDGDLLEFDPSDPQHNPNVGGVNYCDQFLRDGNYPNPGVPFTKADCDYTAYNWPHGLGVGNKNFMDDVAFFLSRMDLRDDLPGNQTLRTHVFGYGDSSPMLRSMAMAGRGMFYRSNSAAELRSILVALMGPAPDSDSSTP
ncbi:hypothetical protein BO221_19910 [Archangium sp. Cb G35]|uniref:hypothetical protein n=1 Tax=Archangium sp. Cb G35 TaxID=1920190 RepID=UPI000937D082|nr:hypothetical protein [Archangium sp. Cb G35]OJT23141.1 hypothetical protein BO221_19910 [Archangium sp. Cb G35]